MAKCPYDRHTRTNTMAEVWEQHAQRCRKGTSSQKKQKSTPEEKYEKLRES